MAEAGARAAVTFCELSEAGPVNVEFETKKLMFAVVARLLFGVDAPPRTRGAVARTLLNGYHATAATLCWTLYLLARHPETLARAGRG